MDLDVTGPARPLGATADQAAYRILQQALANSARQAHCHIRTFSGIFSRTAPQAEHSLEEGNQRFTATSVRPYQRALYSSIDRNCRQAASEMARASE